MIAVQATARRGSSVWASPRPWAWPLARLHGALSLVRRRPARSPRVNLERMPVSTPKTPSSAVQLDDGATARQTVRRDLRLRRDPAECAGRAIDQPCASASAQGEVRTLPATVGSAGEPPAPHTAAMTLGHFNPGRIDGACWHCAHWGGFDNSGTNAVCRHRVPAVHIRALPVHGCAFFTREPGVDDEPGPPPGFAGANGAGWRSLVAVSQSTNLYRPGRHPLLDSTA